MTPRYVAQSQVNVQSFVLASTIEFGQKDFAGLFFLGCTFNCPFDVNIKWSSA